MNVVQQSLLYFLVLIFQHTNIILSKNNVLPLKNYIKNIIKFTDIRCRSFYYNGLVTVIWTLKK